MKNKILLLLFFFKILNAEEINIYQILIKNDSSNQKINWQKVFNLSASKEYDYLNQNEDFNINKDFNYIVKDISKQYKTEFISKFNVESNNFVKINKKYSNFYLISQSLNLKNLNCFYYKNSFAEKETLTIYHNEEEICWSFDENKNTEVITKKISRFKNNLYNVVFIIEREKDEGRYF